jgi:hypothetical protein
VQLAAASLNKQAAVRKDNAAASALSKADAAYQPLLKAFNEASAAQDAANDKVAAADDANILAAEEYETAVSNYNEAYAAWQQASEALGAAKEKAEVEDNNLEYYNYLLENAKSLLKSDLESYTAALKEEASAKLAYEKAKLTADFYNKLPIPMPIEEEAE